MGCPSKFFGFSPRNPSTASNTCHRFFSMKTEWMPSPISTAVRRRPELAENLLRHIDWTIPIPLGVDDQNRRGQATGGHTAASPRPNTHDYPGPCRSVPATCRGRCPIAKTLLRPRLRTRQWAKSPPSCRRERHSANGPLSPISRRRGRLRARRRHRQRLVSSRPPR
jgi:hypothetical protein